MATPHLRGARELERRLRAVERAPRGMSRKWGDEYVKVARPQIPVRTGRTRRSVHVARVTNDGAEVQASQVAVVLDAGAKPHTIQPRAKMTLAFNVGGRTVFSRKVDHPGMRARPFRHRAMQEAWRRTDGQQRIIDAWNGAA